MIVGDRQNFAIEISVLEVLDDWILGKFLFWMNGRAIGDKDDNSVDLKGCVNWLVDFCESDVDRKESELFGMDKNRAYLILVDSIIPGIQSASFVSERYHDTYGRFHISHIGMSSFENLNMVLVENEKGEQRCLWQQDQDEVSEAYFGKGEMYRVASETVSQIRKNMEKKQKKI